MGIPYILAILFVVFAVLILIAIISFDARKSIKIGRASCRERV